MSSRSLALLFVTSLTVSCKTTTNSQTLGKDDIKGISPNERFEYIAKADTWLGDNSVASKDLLQGPTSEVFTTFLPEVDCDFVEPDASNPPGGLTPKFECNFAFNGKTKTLKIKYDPASQEIEGRKGPRNLEVWGEVLSTRLLWALGFAADRIYPVRVRCHNCPLDPWTYTRQTLNLITAGERLTGFLRQDLIDNPKLGSRDTRVYAPAVVEIKYDGPKIETTEGSGWAWPEMYEHMENPSERKLTRDALTILAAFMNHMDNKADQQRLVCRSKGDIKDGVCEKPVLMIQDAGSTFGNGWAPLQGDIRLNKVDFQKWVDLSLWANLKSCQVKINGAPNASLRVSWQVTEQSRALVAGWFAQLSRKQVLDLFKAAQIELLGPVSAETWTDGFLSKVQRDLLNSKCD